MNNSKLHFGFPRKIATLIALTGFFGVGFLMMGLINTYLIKKPQTIQSRAQTLSPIQEAKCINAGGECQTGKLNQIDKPCRLTDGKAGTVVFNYCPIQEGDVRCCIPDTPSDPGQNTLAYTADLAVKLQGINPNTKILNISRRATIKIYNNNGSYENADYAPIDTLTYDSASGNFINSNFNLGLIASGEYKMVIQIQNYLDAQLFTKTGGDIFRMRSGGKLSVAEVSMTAGDIAPGERGDNSINIIDYNALLGCMPTAPPGACLNRDRSDLNDDGIVDQKDMEILLDSYNQNGFAFKTDKIKCEQDPACESGRDTLQLCSLICTRVNKRS